MLSNFHPIDAITYLSAVIKQATVRAAKDVKKDDWEWVKSVLILGIILFAPAIILGAFHICDTLSVIWAVIAIFIYIYIVCYIDNDMPAVVTKLKNIFLHGSEGSNA